MAATLANFPLRALLLRPWSTALTQSPYLLVCCASVLAFNFPVQTLHAVPYIGSGANCSIFLNWSLADGQTPATGYYSTYVTTSQTTFSFPPPSISPNTLFLDDNPPPSDAVVRVLAGNNLKRKLSFGGLNFGEFLFNVNVTYRAGTGLSARAYSCAVQLVEHEKLSCLTAGGEQSGEYTFLVRVSGQESNQGQDVLRFIQTPKITAVRGCRSSKDGTCNSGLAAGTAGCNTSGGDQLTLIGLSFLSGLVRCDGIAVCSVSFDCDCSFCTRVVKF